MAYYRLFYSIIALLSLIPLYSLVDFSLRKSSWTLIGGIIMAVIGLSIMFKSFRDIDTAAFLGLKKEKENPMIISGLYRYSRHPMYLGGIFILLGMILFSSSASVAIFVGMTILYIVIGGYFEELKLKDLYGENYRRYQSQTPFLINYRWSNLIGIFKEVF